MTLAHKLKCIYHVLVVREQHVIIIIINRIVLHQIIIRIKERNVIKERCISKMNERFAVSTSRRKRERERESERNN